MIKKRIGIGLVLLLALAGLVWFGFLAPGGKSSGQHGRHEDAVPVLTATATRQNVPVVLDGVGTIQAYQTVTVQPQVNGKLLSLNFREGQKVKKGQLLAEIDPVTYKATLDQARARLAMDQAALGNARLDFKRYAKLARTNYVSKQQADQTRATVRQDKAQVQSDQAAVDSAQATLGYTSVVAPIAGRTGIRMVDEGNIVTPGDTSGIVVITQLKPISAVFTLPSDEVARVRSAAATGALPVRVLGTEASQVLDTGRLKVINNQVDTATGTIKLKAVLPNANEQLWPGQFVNVRLQIATLDNATVVPIAAVQQGPDGAFVYGVSKNDKAQTHAVQVTQQDDTRAVIARGVTPGERVITAGFGQLSDGARVKLGKANGKPTAKPPQNAASEGSNPLGDRHQAESVGQHHPDDAQSGQVDQRKHVAAQP